MVAQAWSGPGLATGDDCDAGEEVSSDTHKQKEQRNRKEKRRLHPLGAQAETQDWKTVLRHGGALPREAESRRETMVCITDKI